MAALEDVYCTLVMSDSYLPGAAVLAHSLRDAGTRHKLAVLVTLDTLLYSTLAELRKLYDHVIPVDKVANPNLENLARLDRLDLRFAFTKLNLWRQEQFRRIVYIDADVVALRAPDELFDLDASFAAAPDIGWPDCFNSGLMLLKPNTGDFWSLQTLAASGVSFDGADQGLLNEYYQNRPWHRLSFTYNCTPSSGYQYEPAYRHFRSSISMVHFIGKNKPWAQGRQALDSAGSGVYKELLGRWWSVYDRHYRTTQTSASGGVRPDAAVAQLVKGEQSQSALSWASTGHVPQVVVSEPTSSHPPPPPETSAVATEQPMTDPGEESQNIDSGIVASQVAAEPATFVPPQMDWDATRSEPPTQSKPEAASFPSQRYEMSGDRDLFRPPAAYPEPPKNMWYEVPKDKPRTERPPPKIFPWEHNKTAPTRVFAESFEEGNTAPAEPEPKPAESVVPTQPPPAAPPATSSSDSTGQASADPWSSFRRTNAWDNITHIETYVRAVKESPGMRGHFGNPRRHRPQLSSLDLGSPLPLTDAAGDARRESIILTDFPLADERPSLPVTPAPVRRPTFWGEERDAAGELPPAPGVVSQADWNPLASIEQLRRASLLTAEALPQAAPPRALPQRDEPASASSTTGALSGGVTEAPQQPHALDPQLRQPEPVRPPRKGQGVVLLNPDFGPGPATGTGGDNAAAPEPGTGNGSSSAVARHHDDAVDPKSVLNSTAD